MPKRSIPAKSAQDRENQVISLAYNLAEKQIREGTASSQIIHHFLKLGTEKERLERDILRQQSKLIGAKTKSIESQENMDKMYADAIAAMKRYTGNGSIDEDIQ